jgi:inhibitor of KinA sporulation pathway (predicted exonuclease)
MLKGKCKEDFEKWYAKRYWQQLDSPTLEWFFGEYMPFSMQYGVYVDFFDSVGIEIFMYWDIFEKLQMFWGVAENGTTHEGLEDTRNEARQKAIEKAVVTYNSK